MLAAAAAAVGGEVAAKSAASCGCGEKQQHGLKHNISDNIIIRDYLQQRKGWSRKGNGQRLVLAEAELNERQNEKQARGEVRLLKTVDGVREDIC